MARYGQPFWWLRGSLKTWLKNYPTTDKNEAITKWIDAYIEAMEEAYAKTGQIEGALAPGLKYALTREFCYHTPIRLYVQDLDLVEFLKSTSCPQLGAAKAVMSDFMEKYGSV